jgi:hypothetical protein
MLTEICMAQRTNYANPQPNLQIQCQTKRPLLKYLITKKKMIFLSPVQDGFPQQIGCTLQVVSLTVTGM